MKNIKQREVNCQRKEAARAFGAASLVIVGAAGLIVASVPFCANAASDVTTDGSSAGAEATIMVTVKRIELTVDKINGAPVELTSRNSGITRLNYDTYSWRNFIIFHTSERAYVRIYSGDTVIWEGWSSGNGQQTRANFNLPKKIGNYELKIRTFTDKDTSKGIVGYTEATLNLNFKATVPSILPGNSGASPALYMNIGGTMISISTIIIVLALLIVIAVLVSERAEYKSEHQKEEKAKAARKKRAKAKAKARPAKLV